jgi:ribA/ribD-fused uncharacterized protein
VKDPNTVYFWSKGPEEFQFLSNFYPCKLKLIETVFPSAEHFYQCCKTTDMVEREAIRMAGHAARAKQLGDAAVSIREGWEEKKLIFMTLAIRIKFSQNDDLKQMLLSTGDFPLVHFAPWGDKFWGVGKDYEGENMQGKITMQIREELRPKKEGDES